MYINFQKVNTAVSHNRYYRKILIKTSTHTTSDVDQQQHTKLAILSLSNARNLVVDLS